jgi:hypothetical protein
LCEQSGIGSCRVAVGGSQEIGAGTVDFKGQGALLLALSLFIKTSSPVVQTSNLPKYTHPILARLLKSTPYSTFVNSYLRNTDQLHTIIEKERQLFANVGPVSSFHLCTSPDDSSLTRTKT